MGDPYWPSTPWLLVRQARTGPGFDQRALEHLLSLYYAPVQRFFRRVLGVEEDAAGDATHDLFAKLLERSFADDLTHETSFRAFLKLACRRQVSTLRAADATKRRALRTLAGEMAEGRDAGAAADAASLDAAIDEEVRRAYIEAACAGVRAELLRQGKSGALEIFEARTRFDGARPEEYRVLARRFGLKIHDVRNRLYEARKIFRTELIRVAGEGAGDALEELRQLGLIRYVRSGRP